MSTQINAIPPILKETARSAGAISGRINFYIQVGVHLEAILEDIHAERLLKAGAILPLITFFQFLEGLTDAQAINAIRTRVDWKFALHLPVCSPECRESTLCEFRQRVLIDPFCQSEFQKLTDHMLVLNPINPIFNNRFQDIKVLELVSIVCSANRMSLIYETIYQVLEVLAYKFPLWLEKIALPHWYGRYNLIAPGFYAISPLCQQELSIQEMNADIQYLLKEICCSDSGEIKELPEVRVLEHLWGRQFEKFGQVLNDHQKFSKLNGCDFCVYKENVVNIPEINREYNHQEGRRAHDREAERILYGC